MIVALAYNRSQQDQAARLAEWIKSLGAVGNHTLIIATEKKVTRRFVTEMLDCFGECEEFEFTDSVEHYPESKNIAFQQSALYIASMFPQEKHWLYLEPDVVPTRPEWLNEIAREAEASQKPYCGPLVPENPTHGSLAHMAAVAVYPVNLIGAGGGDAMLANEQPFPAMIATVVLAKMKPSKTICHDIDGSQITKTPAYALYHPDRDGKVLALLSNLGSDTPPVEQVRPEPSQEAIDLAPEVAETPGKAPLVAESTAGPGPMAAPVVSQNFIATRSPTIGEARAAVLDLIKILEEAAAAVTTKIGVPWEDRLESEERVKALAIELKQFCTTPARVGYVRTVLRAAKIMPIFHNRGTLAKPRNASTTTVVGRRVSKINLHGTDKATARAERKARKFHKKTGRFVKGFPKLAEGSPPQHRPQPA